MEAGCLICDIGRSIELECNLFTFNSRLKKGHLLRHPLARFLLKDVGV